MNPTLLLAAGIAAGSISGSWAYWQVRRNDSGPDRPEWIAAATAGIVTTIVASLVYVAFGLHKYLAGGSSWGASVFAGLCFGICQGALGRGRPWDAILRAIRAGRRAA